LIFGIGVSPLDEIEMAIDISLPLLLNEQVVLLYAQIEDW
jgi:hypothetical protein